MTTTHCDGKGKLPCACWASVASAPVPCECPPCPGCPACEAVKAAEEAERRAEYESALAYCQAKWGTRPRDASKADKARSSGPVEQTGRLFS